MNLSDIIQFRGDRLFNGAVNIDWFATDPAKARLASESFVFHGPQYHGVHQDDVGTGHGHNLLDTATFACSVVRRSQGREEQPFTLAIAGYGTGKSHFALTLATLLSAPQGECAENILAHLDSAAPLVGSEVRALLGESSQPCLVLALNGMQSFDLTAEITRQIVRDLKSRGLDTKPIENLRPRFAQAVSLIRMSNEGVVKELLTACDTTNVDEVFAALERQDEVVYARVHDFFAARGMTIRALSGESLRDVINLTVREYCGKGKPYRSLVVLFDEFGRYIEFATVRSQIAGSGVLQDLFEAVQANSNSAVFVAFIQFELNAYVQRIAPEFRNDILRYVTRYQGANRVYLSINLETLIANLLEKKSPAALDSRFDNSVARNQSAQILSQLTAWFPQSANHRLWSDPNQFHTIICKGCWPLSPFATWFLFFLASAGKHLQERSALALLGDVIARHEHASVPPGLDLTLAPADLWSDALQHELLSSEESGQQGAITHAFAAVCARHSARLKGDLLRVLKSVVLASKLGLHPSDRDQAVQALAELAGLSASSANDAVALLQDEYNVLEWDEAFKEFDILGDGVPRTQFLSFVRSRVATAYDEAGKARLFAGKAAKWCDSLSDLDCDFAEEHQITTREWRYQAECTYLDMLPQQIKLAADRWRRAFGVDDPRGTILYCYIEPSRDPAVISPDIVRLLRAAAKEMNVTVLPVLVVLLSDEQGSLGQALAELAVLDESISPDDRVRFGNLIPAHQEKTREVLRNHLEALIKQRRYITGSKDALESTRLSRAGTELFSKCYKSPIAFPFDGFSTARGNAADTCQELTMELLAGKLDYQSVIAKPVKTKNRAVTVLKEKWDVFTRTGEVSRRPAYSALKAITEKWDFSLANDDRKLCIAEAIRQLCLPPYGANIASAALIFGVFVAPRADKLVAIREGQQIPLSLCIQNGFFAGKFIDLAAVAKIDLVSVGEASAEWETLLDEWEQADSHNARRDALTKALELAKRIPIPPSLAYRELHLRDQARASIETILKVDEHQNQALGKIEQGLQRKDVSTLSWGACLLRELCDRMKSEGPLWTQNQTTELEPQYARARQAITLHFPEWIATQAPRGDSPDAVGDFKHRMTKQVAPSLRKLGLEELAAQVDARVGTVLRQAETKLEAAQLLRDVNSWLTTHLDAAKIVRIADLRALRETGKEFVARLVGMSDRIQLVEVGTARSRLAAFLNSLKEAESAATKRSSAVRQARLRTQEDIDRLATEVEGLLSIFESIAKEQESFLQMRSALRLYQKAYQQLSNERLSWTEFETLAKQVQADAARTFGDGVVPWSPQDTVESFVDAISKQRKDASAAWIDSLESDALPAAKLSAAEANQFHTRADSPPPTLTEPHAKRLKKVVKDIEARLAELTVEWLVEKFRELPSPAKKKFLQQVAELT